MIVDNPILIFTILTVFVSSVLLLVLIFSNLHWVVKAGLIVLSMFLGAASYYGHREARGWPVAMPLPEKFQLLSSLVVEPSGKDAGSITVWLKQYDRPEPRAIRVPYSKPLHKLMQQGKAKQDQGREAHLEGKPSTKKGAGEANPSPGDPLYDFVPPPNTAKGKDYYND